MPTTAWVRQHQLDTVLLQHGRHRRYRCSQRRGRGSLVRVIIDREGKVKHIHFLGAFPEQAKGITDALMQWRFKPYLGEGQAVEVETGIMFGRALR